MGKIKNTIEINSKIYDATTGALIEDKGIPVPKPTISKRKNIDGIVSSHTKLSNQHKLAAPTERSKSKFSHHVAPPAKPKMHNVGRSAKLSTRRKIEPSHTLMRTAVKKPNTTTRHSINAHGSTDKLTKVPEHVVAHKPSAHSVNERRLSHAKRVNKSGAVTRFSKSTTANTTFTAPKKHSVSQPHIAPPKPIVHHPKSTNDMLQQAIDHATSHREPALKKKMTRPKKVGSLAALGVASFVLLGFVISQSMPTINVKLASAKAGIEAGIPGYQPAGYHLGDLQYGAGVVAMNFDSNSDQERKYQVTQKASEWDSTTLRDIYVQSNDKNFRTVESGGRTLYIYGKNNATWVDKGIWYQVQSTGSLSNRQLLDIAKSL